MMYQALCKTTVPTLLVGLASLGANASTITLADSFEYADQASFEAVYNITTNSTGAATVNLGQDDLDLSTGTGVGNSATTVTNAGNIFELDADTGATLSFDVQANGFNGFTRLRLGVVSVTDPTERLYFQIENRNSDAQFRLVSEGLGRAGIFEQDELSPNTFRGGSFVFDIDGAGATLTRDGVGLGSLASVDISAAGEAEYSRFADGVTFFVEINRSNTANGTATIDNLSFTGTLIPEPGSLSLLALGALGLMHRRRK
ncbi:MAG: PEP-CTERM sorting domain-containing protein [Planctomycetota bacterium]